MYRALNSFFLQGLASLLLLFGLLMSVVMLAKILKSTLYRDFFSVYILRYWLSGMCVCVYRTHTHTDGRAVAYIVWVLYSKFYVLDMIGNWLFFSPQAMGVPSAAILSGWFTITHLSLVVAVQRIKILKSTLFSDFYIVIAPGHWLVRVRRSARRRRQRYIYVLKSLLWVVNIMIYIDGLYVLKSPLYVW